MSRRAQEIANHIALKNGDYMPLELNERKFDDTYDMLTRVKAGDLELTCSYFMCPIIKNHIDNDIMIDCNKCLVSKCEDGKLKEYLNKNGNLAYWQNKASRYKAQEDSKPEKTP